MTKTIYLTAIIAIAFLTGSIVTGSIAFADDDNNKKNPFKKIVNALNKISTAIEEKDSDRKIIFVAGGTSIPELLPADTPATFIPDSETAYLFFGDKLSCIRITTSTGSPSSFTYLFEFGTETIVEDSSGINGIPPSCSSARGIILTDSVDATFKPGDRLVVSSEGPFYAEVFRQQSP